MIYRTLGRTNLKVSEIGFGAWAVGGNSYGTTSDKDSLNAVNCAINQGVNFIDTSDIYGFGRSEELIGKAIKGKRQNLIVATKGGWDWARGATRANYDPKYIQTAIDMSLKRLHTDYIDVYQLHNPPDDLIKNKKELFQLLQSEKKKGKIRFFGISIYVARQGMEWVNTGEVDTIQCIYNLIDQRIEKEFLPLAKEKNIGIIAREPLHCGMLTGKYTAESEFPKNDHRRRWTSEKKKLDLEKISILKSEIPDAAKNPVRFALSFILSHPAVSTVIPGAKSKEQVLENISASDPLFRTDLFQKTRSIYQSNDIFRQGFYRD